MNGEQYIRHAYQAILRHDFEQAVGWFEQAISLEPDNASYHYKLSITYARSGKLAKGLEHAQRAVRLEPDRELYRYHVQHLQAKELAQQAEKLFAQLPPEASLGVALLQEAVRLDPLAIEAYLLLALGYDLLQQYLEALQAINELLKLDPEHEIAHNYHQELKEKLKRYLQT
ncbi:tetratricopeptide repeat protein [Paenibacillus sp. y28]|uniref:tetratricopeptide repeat protein n=1 Tax=Paenibacillus sp. y28 TaxID=3129110 RepID=UPI00301851A8